MFAIQFNASNIVNLRNLLRPVYLIRKTAYEIYRRLNPNQPWIAQGAIRYCEQALDKSKVGLEWGSGGSSIWFGAHLKSLLSVEHDAMWHQKVTDMLKKQGISNVECRYVALDHDVQAPTKPVYEKTPRYVSVVEDFEDGTLDFVVVDGHYRQACILAALPKIKTGGLLLVDNANWLALKEWGVPSDWPMVHQSSNVMTQTTIWQKP